MLCRKCEKSIRAAAKRLNLIPKGLSREIGSTPLHFSLHSFYQSIVTGCLICRQLWAMLLKERDNAIGNSQCLNAPTGLITLNFEEFNGIVKELVNGAAYGRFKPLRSVKKTVRRTICRTVASIVQHPLLSHTKYDKGDLSFKIIRALQEWCRRKSLIWFTIGQLYGRLYISVKCEAILYEEFELSPIPSDTLATSPSDTKQRAQHASTGDTADLWRHWFNTCLETHANCRAAEQHLQPFAPKRLIQLFHDDHGDIFTWRLICSATIGIVSYLTLSHCWGSSQPARLTKDSYSIFIDTSPISRLPKTYQHAFLIAHSLGFQYIWIDSLCIVQDDDEDWRTQSSLMGSIYSHAACNIAATWAADSDDGCFSASDTAVKSPTSVILDFELDGSSEYQISNSLTYDDDITRAPLNQRGWVVQERYLARRQLSFSRRQVYWECYELMASEQFPAGVPKVLLGLGRYSRTQPLTAKPRLDFEKEADIRRTWAALVDLYSICQLTRKSDKLVALSGLATELQSNKDDVYIAGLWRKDLHRQLCWIYNLGVPAWADRTTTRGRIAPTWSWANLDGPVMYDRDYYFMEYEPVRFMELLEVPVDLTGRLALRGIAVWGHALANGDQAEPIVYFHEYKVILADGLRTPGLPALDLMCITIFWDENMSSPNVDPDRWSTFLKERSSDLLFLLVLTDSSNFVKGLVLRMLPFSTDESVLYVRMGSFKMSEFPLLDHLAARLGLPRTDDLDFVKRIDLSDSRLADLVHTLTIV